jgi:hypothetical protein
MPLRVHSYIRSDGVKVKSHTRKTPVKTYGPRKQVVRRKMVKPTNIIMVGPGGSAHIHSGAKKVKSAYGNTHVGGRSIFAQRKVRKNKGAKRLAYKGMSPSLFK